MHANHKCNTKQKVNKLYVVLGTDDGPSELWRQRQFHFIEAFASFELGLQIVYISKKTTTMKSGEDNIKQNQFPVHPAYG